MSALDGRTSFLRLFEQHLSFAPAYPKPQDALTPARTPARRRDMDAAQISRPEGEPGAFPALEGRRRYSRSPWEIKFRRISRTAFRVSTNRHRPEARRRS